MKKMMFNDRCGLTKAVLDGYKTMTRRVISDTILGNLESFRAEYYEASLDMLDGADLIEAYFVNHPKSLPYHVGDVVAVAQNYETVCAETDIESIYPEVLAMSTSVGWRNKMFVRADLMPHRIRITSVRYERLQDISAEDCMKEGIEKFDAFGEPASYYFTDSKNNIYPKGWRVSPREAYAALIDKVSGRGTWLDNPWVIVYEFELEK